MFLCNEIPPLARKRRPLRTCHRHPLTRTQPTAHTALHPRRALRHRRVTRARAPAHRRLNPPRPAARDADDPRQPQAGADLHWAHDLPADDGHQRHQPVRAADPQSLSIKGTAANLFATSAYGIVKMTTCAAFLLFAADSLGRRRSLLWTLTAQDTAMFYIGLHVRIDPPATGHAVSPAGCVALVCVFPFTGFFQRLGPRVLDLCQRDPDGVAAQLGRRDCGRDAVAV